LPCECSILQMDLECFPVELTELISIEQICAVTDDSNPNCIVISKAISYMYNLGKVTESLKVSARTSSVAG
ncbi:mCG1028389, partial [Mus musculus]